MRQMGFAAISYDTSMAYEADEPSVTLTEAVPTANCDLEHDDLVCVAFM
ncbi:hypothetical protein PR003_g6796 [Phytophthora rubi]|uniref:Uncharacterized protein n=1 Tax=Phytophthora rubi TaxID=129364 RepID=A0A6A3N5U1_9STRA|nr:hypothetical protein PR001_g27037 [Phytophthora rubi]KAE9036990.1 hypothetical protein PR002_g6811 [Phytophthora rubi]KAE9347700.1 hypothetical protein PR003_g6796 [Phytophthora rubi]